MVTKASSSSSGWRVRWRNWWIERLPAQDQQTLTHRNVYILPTRAGWMLALTLLVLLLASINYQLNLGYLLTFLIAGAATAGMWVGHSTLRGLQLHLRPPPPVFAGSACQVPLIIDNPSSRVRHGVGILWADSVRTSSSEPAWNWLELLAQGSDQVQMAFQPTQRGWQTLPVIQLQTRFPLGNFRCWTLWRTASRVLVYPQPEANAPNLPVSQPHPGGRSMARSQQPGEFDGVRNYRRGDPLQQVLWKKAAQAMAAGSDQLVSREQQSLQPHSLWLEASLTGCVGIEAQAARLCAWILQAEQQGADYGLRLTGDVQIAPSQGPAHQARCLEALALWQ